MNILPHMHFHNTGKQVHQTPNRLYKGKRKNLICTILIRLSLAEYWDPHARRNKGKIGQNRPIGEMGASMDPMKLNDRAHDFLL